MKIVIPNAHWNNRGDEAAHRALWGELRKLYPTASVKVLIKDRKSVEQFPDLPGFSAEALQFKAPIWEIWLAALSRGVLGFNSALKRSVRILASADLIIYPPGGAVISDRFFWSKQMEYLLPFLCARLYGTPTVVASPSMGPFDPRPVRRVRKWLLKAPRAICVREDISRKYLAAIGVEENVNVSMDLAFLDDVDATVQESLLEKYTELRDFLSSHDKVVGITISDFKWHVRLGKDPELSERVRVAFMEFIKWLTARGYGVLLVPQLFGNQNDIDYLGTFSSPNVFVLDENYDAYFQQFVIGKLHSVVGMRYHSNIFAAKMGTPFIAIPYEEKMQGFLELADLMEYALALNDFSTDRLRSKFEMLEAGHDSVTVKLATQRNEWRSRARKTLEILEATVRQSN
jgi:colanic acid/amylovoran biosynthesis protein